MKKHYLVLACLSLAMVAPVAQAGVISIDDSTDTLLLFVNGANQITHPGDFAPGSGTQISLTGGTNTSGIDMISYNAATESLSFRFANQINWGSDVNFFRNYSEDATSLSDLFSIQGIGGTAPDYISFISDPGSFGNVAPITNAPPVDLGTVAETGDWQLAFDTGVDQYYIRSDIDAPEPATLTLLGIGIAGMAGYGWRRRKTAAA